MKKLVCPCCGWSDFFKYDDEETVYCLACGLEYSEGEVLRFEKEVLGDDGDYGITVVNAERGEYGSFNGHKSDAYYRELSALAEEQEYSHDETFENSDMYGEWQILDGPSPFD